MTTVALPETAQRSQMPAFAEFVGLIALMMAVSAFSIDNLLPAFDAVRAEYRVADPNDLQLLVYGFMLAFGSVQFIYGPISDVVGRRPVLLTGLAIYAAGSVLALVAPSFSLLLAARVIQGIGAASTRVLAVTIVRDRYSGREMARVMSITMMVFLMVPIFAPAIGSLLMLLGSWHWIFGSMLVLAVVLGTWFGLRMPETLDPDHRLPLSASRILEAFKLTVTTRVSFGYATGIGLMMGCLMAYIGSSQQILEGPVYRLGPAFPLYFALVAGTMGIGSFTNSRLVRRLGARRMSHFGVCGFTLVAAVQLAVSLLYDGEPPLGLFLFLLCCHMALFSLTVPNFNAIAMGPLGAIAGTAASLIGSYTTLVGALCGVAIGRAFNETVIPLGTGFFVLSAVCLFVVLWTERGRLFAEPPASAAGIKHA